MPEKGQDRKTQKDNAQNQSDSEARLQDELSRESSEGADSIGDVASNRTLSGSSTWETLPDDASSAEGAGSKDRKPKQE